MDAARRLLRNGIFGQGWRNALVAIGLAIAVYLSSKSYGALNHGPNRLFLRTPLDEAMPTVKVFVLPYVSLEAVTYGTLVFFLFFRLDLYRSAAVSLTAAFLIAGLFFMFAQTYVQRPTVTGDDTLSRMIRGVYSADNPYNDFPSLHVGVSTVLAIHWWRYSRVTGWIAATWAVVVIAATQLIHQHYLVDIPGGLALAFGVSLPALRWFIDRRGGGGASDRVVEAAPGAGVAGGTGGSGL